MKFVPFTVTTVPAAPAAGVKLAIVGAPGAVTTKSCVLAIVLPPTVTDTLPVVALAGTVTTSELADAAVTVAVAPLNDTAFSAAVPLNPVPLFVIAAPGGPLAGEKLASVMGAGLTRWMPTMLPAAS